MCREIHDLYIATPLNIYSINVIRNDLYSILFSQTKPHNKLVHCGFESITPLNYLENPNNYDGNIYVLFLTS